MKVEQSEYPKIRLPEVVQINIGKTPSRRVLQNFGGGFPWISISDLKGDKYISETKETLSEIGIKSSNIKAVKANTLLFSFKLSIGKTAITRREMYTNEAIASFPIKDPKKLDINYFYYVMSSFDFSDAGDRAVMGTTLNKAKLRELQIPLPPLPVQQKIAAILDAADAYRQKTKALIEKYDQLAQSLFLDMFGDPVRNEKGWEVKAGEEYCSEITVGVVIKPASYYVEEGVVALRSLNIKPNAFDLSNLVYFSKESHSTQLKKSILNESDIVIVRTGNTGTAAVIPESLSNSNCIDLIIVRPNKMIVNPKYITYLINSKPGKKLVSGKEVGGIQKHFNIGSFKKLLLPIPPKEIQDQFVESINIIDQQRLKLEISMIKSEELFQSLLQKAFNGDLVS